MSVGPAQFVRSAIDPQSSGSTSIGRSRISFGLVEPGVIGCDALVILAASLASSLAYHWFFYDATGSLETAIALGVLVFVNFAAISYSFGNYRPANLTNRGRQLRYVTLIWWLVCALLLGVAFTLKISEDFSRGATLSFFATGWLALVAQRMVISGAVRRALQAGTFAQKRVVLIADQAQLSAARVTQTLRNCGYPPAYTFEVPNAEAGELGVGPATQRMLADVITVCQEDNVDHIFLLLPWNRSRCINELVQLLRVVPIPIHLLPDANVAEFFAQRSTDIGTVAAVELKRAPLTRPERALKRACDVIGAATLLVLLSPLLVATAALIKLDSKGPVLFRQKRNGFNGRTFAIYKFRSMRVLEDGERIVQARRNDPRVTRAGAWLRRTSIDELPQLLNVLSGDMSLVGPRPHAVAHNNEYQNVIANYAYRHHVKPGITGWAQVNGLRGETSTVGLMARRVELDLWYINHWSVWLDLRILLKTLFVVHRQPTAY